MRILLVRLWRFVGWWGAASVALAAGIFLAAWLWDLRITPILYRVPVEWALFGLPAIVVALLRYQRRAGAKPHEVVLAPLLASRQEYCLVLRPFGADGEFILPVASRRNRVGQGVFTRNVTIEQAVVEAARAALQLPTYAIVDPRMRLNPPGVAFISADHSDWQRVVRALIGRAHSIVLILPPGQDVRSGFDWEIRELGVLGLRDRTVIVLPPLDQYPDGHTEAVGDAAMILARLSDPDLDADEASLAAWDIQFRLQQEVILARFTERGGLTQWHAVPNQLPRSRLRGRARRQQRQVTTHRLYVQCLAEEFTATAKDLADVSFENRYRLG